jgi:hypothetical protein
MKKIMFNSKYGLDKAVLEGRKTMTRRIIPEKLIVEYYDYDDYCNSIGLDGIDMSVTRKFEKEFFLEHFPYKVGEIIAIAQSYKSIESYLPLYMKEEYDGYSECLDISFKTSAGWDNKMFVKARLMPWAIKITNVKVERLQDITSEDCLKEGIFKHISHAKVYYMHEGIGNYFFETPRHAFASLIDRVSGKGTWESNPWVWVYEFELTDNPNKS